MDETIPITYKGKVLAKAKVDATELFLANMGIEDICDIEGLNQLPDLKILYLHNNKITRIFGLDHLTGLEELHLGSNKITKIEGLDRLNFLKRLYMASFTNE